MNKRKIEEWIPLAKNAIEKTGISKDGKILKSFRGQISSFGAAVTMGSMKAAVAFFSDNGGASVKREELMKAILEILQRQEKEVGMQVDGQNKPIHGKSVKEYKTLAEYVFSEENPKLEDEMKEEIINAAIAIKLAMNLFELVDDKKQL